MLENFKKKLKDKIERDAIKSKIGGEVIYLKKSKLPMIGDWARIYPPINEDGSINWINLLVGGKKNLVRLILVLIVIGMFLFGVYEILKGCNYITNNPCVQSCISGSLEELSNIPSII